MSYKINGEDDLNTPKQGMFNIMTVVYLNWLETCPRQE